jgi:hypothetical protein
MSEAPAHRGELSKVATFTGGKLALTLVECFFQSRKLFGIHLVVCCRRAVEQLPGKMLALFGGELHRLF